MEKASNTEVKANLQSLFYIRNIDARYSKSHRLSTKKDKEDTYQNFKMRLPRIKTRLSFTTPPIPRISFRFRLPRKTNTIIGEAI